MTGDFLSLLEKQRLPTAGTASHAIEPIQATTVFADKTEKILELDSHSLMAIAGVPATAFEMARTLQTAFEYYRRSQLQQMSLPAKIRALSKLLRDNLPATIQGFGIVSPIFAGVELADREAKPVIYF